MQSETVFLTLFAVATIVALLARRFHMPYTVALVLAGLGLGAAHALEPPHLTKELLYTVFLPGLIFEAAFHLETSKYLENKLAIHALAVPGVIASIVFTAGLLVPAATVLDFAHGFRFQHGLAFGALIAATDPIAVVALFRSLGVPKRLSVLVEGESLLNDGTSIVFFTLIVGFLAGGTFTWSAAIVEFLKVAGMGAVVGLALGFLGSKVIQQVDDPMIEITLTTLVAWGSFVAAEHFHFSGVISTVAAGLLSGNYGARTGMSPTTRVAVETFWEYVAFALNSLIFLLIGFEVRLDRLLASWLPILVAYCAVVLARAAMTFVVSVLLRPTRERVPWTWSAVLTWGGLRGALSMVLVLGLPEGFPFRELLVTMTFGVVLLSILVQGLTMAPLLRWLGVAEGTTHAAYERHRGEARAVRAALVALEKLVADGVVHADVANALRSRYTARLAAAEGAIRDLHLAADELRREEERTAGRYLLAVEKEALVEAQRRGLIGDATLSDLAREIDARLRSDGDDDGPPAQRRERTAPEPPPSAPDPIGPSERGGP